MIEKLNSKIRPLLEIYDKLKDVFEIAKIKTPIIATCGMQSHGKSSTLESITKIELPTKAETCTICPIKICLRELKNESSEKPYYSIKIEDEEYNENDKHLTNFKKLKDKIDEYQDKVRKQCGLKEQNITEKKIIQLNIYKKNVPNLNLYDLPGVTHVKGIQEEAERIYTTFLNDKETIVLLVLNGGDDLTNSSVTQFMRNIDNYQNKFIPVIAKADLLKNLNGKLNQLKGMKLCNKPFLIINKSQEYNLNDKEEVAKIKEIIPEIVDYKNDVFIGRKQLIEELIKIQYNQYSENFRDITNTIKKEIEKNNKRIEELPKEIEEEKFWDIFLDTFEELLKSLNELIKNYKKGPEGDLLKYEIREEYKKYIVKSKEKINEFLTLENCNYITKNIEQTNSDKISIIEDEVPFHFLIIPKLKEILSIFEEIIRNIYDKITNKIKEYISDSFCKFRNLENEIQVIYDEYSKSQFDKMNKFYKEICFLETRNTTSFDLELNYKCNVLTRKILHFIYKKKEIPLKEQIDMEYIEEKKEEENSEPNNKDINTNIDSNNLINNNIENNINNNENENKGLNDDDTDDTSISDFRDDIKKGVKDINKFTIEQIKGLTQTVIDKLFEEVQTNPNFKKDIKIKQKEYKGHIKQIIGIINNYDIEHLTRIYDSLGCKGRPKLSYTPENITTFDERIEHINIDGKDGYEFIPGFEYIKKKNLNDFICFFKAGKVELKTANIIIRMVAYSEVMCNRVIDIIYLSIQNYLYDYLTNNEMINHLRSSMIKKIGKEKKFENNKRLLEVNKRVAEEIETCKYNKNKLEQHLKEIEEAEKKFTEKDNTQENEEKIEESQNNKIINNEIKNIDNSADEE